MRRYAQKINIPDSIYHHNSLHELRRILIDMILMYATSLTLRRLLAYRCRTVKTTSFHTAKNNLKV